MNVIDVSVKKQPFPKTRTFRYGNIQFLFKLFVSLKARWPTFICASLLQIIA